MPKLGLIIGLNTIPVNRKILSLLEEKYSFKREYAKKCLLNNKHNHVTTTYYLLYQKYERLGMLSKEDELDLLSEEEDSHQNFHLNQQKSHNNEEQSLLNSELMSNQKLSQTQRIDLNERSPINKGQNQQDKHNNDPNNNSQIYKLEPSIHQQQMDIAINSGRGVG